jgi:hypothetical protein
MKFGIGNAKCAHSLPSRGHQAEIALFLFEPHQTGYNTLIPERTNEWFVASFSRRDFDYWINGLMELS